MNHVHNQLEHFKTFYKKGITKLVFEYQRNCTPLTTKSSNLHLVCSYFHVHQLCQGESGIRHRAPHVTCNSPELQSLQITDTKRMTLLSSQILCALMFSPRPATSPEENYTTKRKNLKNAHHKESFLLQIGVYCFLLGKYRP